MFISSRYQEELLVLINIIRKRRKNQKIIFAPAGLETIRLIRCLKLVDILPDYVYDDNDKLINCKVEGITVINSAFNDLIHNSYIVINSTTFMEKMFKKFVDIGVKTENLYTNYSLLLLQYLSMDKIENIGDKLIEDCKKVSFVYDLLADDKSRESFIHRIEYMKNPCQETAIQKNIDYKHKFFHYQENESVLDGGAFDGKFMEEFIETVENKFANYYAIEPNRSNYDILKSRSSDPRVKYFNTGLCSGNAYYEMEYGMMQTSIYSRVGMSMKQQIRFHSIDSLFSKVPVTLLKLNINGFEKEALCGAKNTIKRELPNLMISCYYYVMDFVEIPYMIKKNYPEYSIYLRDCSSTIYDTVLFAKVK